MQIKGSVVEYEVASYRKERSAPLGSCESEALLLDIGELGLAHSVDRSTEPNGRIRMYHMYGQGFANLSCASHTR